MLALRVLRFRLLPGLPIFEIGSSIALHVLGSLAERFGDFLHGGKLGLESAESGSIWTAFASDAVQLDKREKDVAAHIRDFKTGRFHPLFALLFLRAFCSL